MSDEYLWTGEGQGAADEFVAALERGLAPLDDAEAIGEGLELDALAERLGRWDKHDKREGLEGLEGPSEQDRDGGVVLALHPPEPRRVAPMGEGHPRNWLWLAAAIVVLGVSVGVLAHDRGQRQAGPSSLEVAGSGSGRVIVTATDPPTHVRLRSVYASLSRCVVELEPGSAGSFDLHLEAGALTLVERGLQTQAQTDLGACVEAAFTELSVDRPITLELEFHGPESRR